ATTHIAPLSLHDALPIWQRRQTRYPPKLMRCCNLPLMPEPAEWYWAGLIPKRTLKCCKCLVFRLAPWWLLFWANKPCHCLTRQRSEEHTSELQSRFDLVC